MNLYRVDVVVLGSGFAGSLAAMLLAKEGRSVALVERGKHPRFAIGESSTPLADFKLRDIAARYDLPQLNALSRYGDWISTYPEIMRGVKRGFSYFSQHQGQAFQTDKNHTSELLVTANSSQTQADTHWLRSDVDAFMVDEAVRAGVIFLDETSIENSLNADGFRLIGIRAGHSITIDTRFVVVATGNSQVWDNALSIPSTGQMPRTRSRTLFAHFANLKPWSAVMRDAGLSTEAHPFDCDQAALHHVFDGGWMWQLRFDDNTTSVGFMLDTNRYPIEAGVSTEDLWQSWLSRFPSIQNQFVNATIVRPLSGLQRIDRLQHELRQVAGGHWALLPAAVGFADPLFSTGIGHALFAVERLVIALRDLDRPAALQESLTTYSSCIAKEIDLIDRLVSLAYRASSNFSQYVTAAMTYFAAATMCEQSARMAGINDLPAFLLADNRDFLLAVDQIEQAHRDLSAIKDVADATIWFERSVCESLSPFNRVGLFSPDTPRMYRYTAAK